MATKFGSKLVITQLICEISPRFLRLTGGSRVGVLNDVSQILPRPTLVAIATKYGSKIGYNSARTTYISDILASTGGLRGRVIERCQSNSSTSHPGCHGNENWTKTRLNSACMRYISQILKSSKVFIAELSNAVSQILPRLTTVAIATKFEEFGWKLAITRFA